MRFTLDLWAGEGEALAIVLLCVLAQTYKLGACLVALIALARSICFLFDKIGLFRGNPPVVIHGPSH